MQRSPAVLSRMQRMTPADVLTPRAHIRAVAWRSAQVDGRGEGSKMHMVSSKTEAPTVPLTS